MIVSAYLMASDSVQMGNLEWQDTHENKSMKLHWAEGNIYCQELILGEHTDWRLPTIEELLSISDNTQKPSIHKSFKYVLAKHYWTSNLHIADATKIWAVNFNIPAVNSGNRSLQTYVRCVRNRSQ